MLFLLTEHHCRHTLTGSKDLLKRYLLTQLQKVIIRFKKLRNSISEQTHGKKAATVLSISSTPGGEDAQPLKGVKELCWVPTCQEVLTPSYKLGPFPEPTFTSPWELESLWFTAGTEATAALWSVLGEGMLKTTPTKPPDFMHILWASFNWSQAFTKQQLYYQQLQIWTHLQEHKKFFILTAWSSHLLCERN